jgi:hypothetical protein
LWRWGQLPAFNALVDSFQHEATTEAGRRLRSAALEAVQTMVGLLSADDDRIRLAAARDVLDRVGLDSLGIAPNQAEAQDQSSMAIALLEQLRAEKPARGPSV